MRSAPSLSKQMTAQWPGHRMGGQELGAESPCSKPHHLLNKGTYWVVPREAGGELAKDSAKCWEENAPVENIPGH